MEARIEQNAPFPAVKLVAGLFFTAVGILLTLDHLDLFETNRILRYWPVVLVVLGVIKLLQPYGNRLAAAALILGGTWLLALRLHWIRISIFDVFWPLLLIGLGAILVARALGWRADASGPGLAIFGSRNVASTSSDFRHASASAVLGQHQLDLTGADIVESPAIVDTFAFWGAVEIIVPDHWEIVGDVTPVMGGFEVRTEGATAPGKRLIVRGTAIMGGIEVKSASRRTR